MLFEKTVSLRTTAAAVLCLVLSSAPLVACSGQSSAGEGEPPTATSQAAAVDVSSWKTLGDAFAVRTDSLSSGWDEHYYVSVFRADLRKRLGKSHFVYLIGNYLRRGESVDKMLSFSHKGFWCFGAQYSYQTKVGPLTFNLHWSDYKKKKVGAYLSFGYYF